MGKRSVLVLQLASGLGAMSYGTIFTIVDDLRDGYGISEARLGLIMGVGFFAGFVANVFLAPLADRGHAKRMIVIGIVVQLLGNLAFGFAHSFLPLFLARAVLGIGGGFILVPALIYVFRVQPNVVVGTSLFQILFTMVAATIFHAATNQSVDIFLALLLMVGGTFGAQFGARAGANLRGEYFRLLLGVLILVVAGRFAADILTPPREPFSVTRTETVR